MIMVVLLCFSFWNFCKMTGGEQKQVTYRSLNVVVENHVYKHKFQKLLFVNYTFILHYFIIIIYSCYIIHFILQGHSLKAALVVYQS